MKGIYSTTYQNKEPQQYKMISFKGKIMKEFISGVFYSLHCFISLKLSVFNEFRDLQSDFVPIISRETM